MRRFPALLCVAALAAAPASAAAGPPSTPPTIEASTPAPAVTTGARLGVMVMALTPTLRQHFGAPAVRGVLATHTLHAMSQAGDAPSGSWLRDWMSRFTRRHAPAPTSSSADPASVVCKLRTLFTPPSAGPVCERT